ncbi:MAG: hypothetical protein PSX81_09595, partial [bacterium]|nr:hypothetical protein [bacterium]
MKQFLIFFFFVTSLSVIAQRPQNDTCSKSIKINLGSANFGIGTFWSDSVSIDSGTIQIGEYFHSSLVSAGNDKKSVWFKFYLPARRGINIELKQTANAIGVTDCGFTTFYGDQCLPTSTMATSAKITTLNQFGSSFHPCMDPGWYMIQVSSKARAMGKIYIKVTTSFPYTHFGVSDAQYDAMDSAFYLGNQVIGKKGFNSQYKDFELGCYTIKDSTEYFYAMGNKYARFTQSAWFVFKANGHSDNAWFGVEGYNYYMGSADTIAHRLYSGDCRGGGKITIMDSAYSDMGSGKRCYSYYGALNFNKPCTFDSGKFYTLQLLFHKDEQRVVRLTLSDATSQYDVNNNHQPISGNVYDLGLLNANKIQSGGFSCGSKMKYNGCGNANPSSNVKLFGYRYNLSNWFKFSLNQRSKVDLALSSAYNYNNPFISQMAFRVFKDTVTNGCGGIDTASVIYQGTGNAWYKMLCLEKGNYVVQVLGMDTSYTNYSDWSCYGRFHLGRDYQLYLNWQRLPENNRFSLFGKKWADSVYVKADTLSPIPKNLTVYMGNDTIACSNTVRPERNCDSTLNKAIYRVFKIGDSDKDGKLDSGVMFFSGLLTNYTNGKYRSDHALYKGNVLKLRQKQNVSMFPDTIKGLKQHTTCFGQSYSYGSVCMEPGEYTMVSYFDDNSISIAEQPSLTFFAPKTKYNHYSRAENLGSNIKYETKYGNYDTFSCSTNPDTIDGVYCGRRNTYHVFHLDSTAVATSIGVNYYYAYGYAGARWSLFTGDIRNGKSGLQKYNNGGDWTCNNNSYYRSTTDCKPMVPGWYTIMVSNDFDIGYDSLKRNNSGYTGYYMSIFPHRIEMSFRKPNIILPRYDKPNKSANIDSLLNNKNPLSYAVNYSLKKNLPQKLEKFVFPTEYLQCDLDTPFTHFKKSNLCDKNATNIIYYTFSIAKSAWANINTTQSGLNSFKLKLYNFDVRKFPARLDTATPVQNCNYNSTNIEFCNLKPGTYTLIYFANRYVGQNSYLTPVLYLDSLMPTRFDHAINAYDFGRIPGDSAWHHGKKGDINPFDTSLYASQDAISCSTGAQYTDPNVNTCYNQWNPYVYDKSKKGVIYPNDSPYVYRYNTYHYFNSYGPTRNIWYTFTHKGPGKISLKLNTLDQKYSNTSYNIRYQVYESDVDATIPFDSLKKNGGLDSSTTQGLKYITSDGPYTLQSGAYCYYPSNYEATFSNSICDAVKEKRYYVLVQTNNHPSFPYAFNHHVSLSIKYDTLKTIIQKTKFDYYSEAGVFPDTANKNLILNHNGQLGNTIWKSTFYSWTSSTKVPSGAGTSLSAWAYYYSNPYLEQIVSLAEYKADIATGNCTIDLSAMFLCDMTMAGSNGINFQVEFLDVAGSVIQTKSTGAMNSSANVWSALSNNWSIPTNAVKARFRIIFMNSGLYYPTIYINNMQVRLKKSSVPMTRSLKLASGVVYEAARTYMGQASVDAADYVKNNKTNCGKSVWYKFRADTTGYVYFGAKISYASGTDLPFYYGTYSSRLFKEIIPGDSVNGLVQVGTTDIGSTKIEYARYACVSPGWYYININPTCPGYTQNCLDYVQPLMYFDYHQGDYCNNAYEMKIDTLEKVLATAIVNCQTIGTDFGEDGTNMGCLSGPKGYKSTWFKVDYTDTAKIDLEFKLAENTSAKPSDIRYRTYYGNCQNLTPAPCNSNSQTSFIINCIRKGTYYIQVVTPDNATGTITMSVEAKKNKDSTCIPVNIFKPNAAFYYNASCPENVVEFVNTSSRGDSITYKWNFGYNNAVSTALNPMFAYPASATEKTYKVKLQVSMISKNVKDSIEIDVVVPYSPFVDIITKDTMLCDGDSVWLKARTSQGKGIWNTGSLPDSIKVGRTGYYYYKIQDKPNLLLNANGEKTIPGNGWTAAKGTWGNRYYTPYPHDSTYYFSAGSSTGESELYQIVNISSDSVLIDSGLAKTSMIAYAYSKAEDTPDETQLVIEYLDSKNNLLALYSSGYFASRNEWTKIVHTRTTPKKTRKIKVRLYSNNLGSDAYNDAFFDHLSLRMRSACDYQDSVYVQINAIPKVKLGKDTTFCYHDTLLLKPVTSYLDPHFIDEPMDGTPLKGELLVNANYIPAYKYTVLTTETASDFGAVNYSNTDLLLTDSFDISTDLYIENKDGLDGAWTSLYLFNTKKPANYNFYYDGGYSIFIQEYYNTNQILIYWGSSYLTAINLNMKLSDKIWRTFLVRYSNKRFIFFINGKQVGSYKDNNTRTQTGYNYGVLASNHAYQNTHLVRNFFVTRSKYDTRVTPANKQINKYTWNDGSNLAQRPVLKSGLYIVKVTDKFGCKSKSDSVNINRIKTYDSLIVGQQKVCSMLDTFRIYSTIKSGYFYGSPAIDSSGLVTVANAKFGSNNYMRFVKDTFGCYYKDTGVFVVDSIPDIIITPVAKVCKNIAPFKLNVNSTDGVFYGGVYVDSAGWFYPSQTTKLVNKVYYRTKGNYCIGMDSITVEVDTVPSAKIQAVGPFCKNAGIKQISHASNAGGKYSGGLYIDSTGKFNPNIAGVSTQKVYYTFVDSRGCKNTDSIAVRIDSVPSAKIAAAGPFCKNAGIKQMSHASNAGGKYSGGLYIDSTGKFNPNIAGVSTQKVYYSFVDSRGCKNTDSINVRVDSIPSAKIQAAGPFCKNAGIKQINHASNAGGKYSGGNYVDTLGVFNPNIAGVSAQKVYYTFKDSRGCSNTDSISIRVDSIPSAKIQAAGPYCKNAGIKQINHASNAGGKYSGGTYIDSIGKFNPLIAGVSTKKVFYTFTDSRGCKNTDSINVRVDSIPSAKIQAAGPFCKNAGIKQMSHASNAGGKYSGGTYIDSIGKFNPIIAGVSTKKVYYTFVDSRGCKNTDSINIRVDSIPSAKIQAAGPFCKNAGIQQISHASNAGGKYSGGTYIDSVGKFNPNIANIGVKKVYYTFKDSRGCSNTDSISVKVDSVPSAKIAAAGPFCKNAGIKQMSHASNAGGKYTGGAYIDSLGKFNPLIAGVSTKKIFYTFTDSRGCKNTDSISVRIDSVPSAKIAAAGPFCKNAGIQQISHASNAGGKYSGGAYIDSTGRFNPNIAGVSTQKVYYTFVDSRGCKNTDSITVRIDSVPNAKIQLAGPFCKNAGIQQISHASNAGGKYSGGNYVDTL